MNLDLNNSESVDFPNLMVRYGFPIYIPTDETVTMSGRLPMGDVISDDYNYGFDGENQSNMKGGTIDEIVACGKRPKITNSKKGKAWGRCVTDFHAGSGTISPRDVLAHCGKKPFWIGKRRQVYNRCKSDLYTAAKAKVIADKLAAQAAEDASLQQQADQAALDASLAQAQSIESALIQKSNEIQTPQPQPSSKPNKEKNKPSHKDISPPPPPPKKKSNALLIGVGVLVLGVVGFIVFKKMTK